MPGQQPGYRLRAFFTTEPAFTTLLGTNLPATSWLTHATSSPSLMNVYVPPCPCKAAGLAEPSSLNNRDGRHASVVRCDCECRLTSLAGHPRGSIIQPQPPIVIGKSQDGHILHVILLGRSQRCFSRKRPQNSPLRSETCRPYEKWPCIRDSRLAIPHRALHPRMRRRR